MTDPTPPPFAASAPRAELLEAASTVLSLCGREGLGLFRAAPGGPLNLAGSGPEGGASYRLAGAVVETPGDAVVPLAPLAQALRYSTGDRVAVTTTRAGVVVTIDPGSLPARTFEFPHSASALVPTAEPPGDFLDRLTLPAADFRHLVHHTAFAAERREREGGPGWATLGGQLAIERRSLTLSATDTYRLATCGLTLAAQGSSAKRREYLLPVRSLKAFAESARLADSVTLTLTDARAFLAVGPLTAWAPLLSGRFPPTAAARAELPHAITLPRAPLLSDVEAALAFTDPEDPALVLATAPGLCTLSPQSGERGTCELVTRVPTFTGPRLVVALHGPGLAGLLAAYADKDEVTVAWESAEKPLVVSAGSARCMLAPRVLREQKCRT